MRVAVFTSKYPAEVATFFERDMRALLEAGLTVEVFAIRPLERELWRYSLDLVGEGRLPRERIHHLTLPAGLAGSRPALRRRARTCLADAARALSSAARFGPVPFAKTAYVFPMAWTWAATGAGRFDHVLAYWGNYAGTCAYAFHRLLERRVPYSIWLHAGTDLYRTPVFLRRKLAYADNVLTCCDFNRDYILRRFADLAERIEPKLHVCHHGLDLEQFPYRPEGRPPATIVAVGRLAAYKGFDYLLLAAHLLLRRGLDVTVEMVGGGERRDALQALSADLGLGDRVRFHGWVPFPQARLAMSNATVLVHPSEGLGDGLPNVVREAMALGTPVVASRVAGIPDALSQGCGVMVPPRDPAALADAIQLLLDDPAGRRRIAELARRRVEDRYDQRRNGAALARLLAQTRRGGPSHE